MNYVAKKSVINLSFALFNVLLLVAITSLATRVFPVAILGVFLLIRQWVAVGSKFLQCGTSQTLICYLPRYSDRACFDLSLLLVNLLTILFVFGVLTFFIYLWNDKISLLLFNNLNSPLVWSVYIFSLSLALNYNAFSFFIAKGKIITANIYSLMNTNILLLIFIILYKVFRYDFYEIFLYSGILSCLNCIFLLVNYSRKRIQIFQVKRQLKTAAKFLYSYGFPRIITPALESSLVAIGPWFMRHNSSEASYLVLALMVVKVVQIFFMSITQVFSVTISKQIGDKNTEATKKVIQIMLFVSILAGFISYISLIFLKYFLALWLHNDVLVNGVYYYALTLILLLPFILCFYTMRGVIEVYTNFPWIGFVIGLSLLSFLVFYFVMGTVLISIMAMYIILGSFTLVLCYLIVRGYIVTPEED